MIAYVCNKCKKYIDLDDDYEAMEFKPFEGRPITSSKTYQKKQRSEVN